MARKKTPINLSQPIQPRGGDFDRLFAGEDDAEQAVGLQLLAVRVDAIDPDPDQPRSTMNEDGLRELAQSIQQDGVIQPIEVTQSGRGRYRIVHGERRWQAAKRAGLETIPAIVRRRDYDDVTRFVRQVMENIQREDLNDVDRAAALFRLRDLMQEELDAGRGDLPGRKGRGDTVKWPEVGERLGYSRQRIHQLINLLKLPDEIKDAIREGTLSERDTRVYQGLTAGQQQALHRARAKKELTSAQVHDIARRLRHEPDATVTKILREIEADAQKRAGAASPPAPRKKPGDNILDASQLPGAGPNTNLERLRRMEYDLSRIELRHSPAAERGELLQRLRHIAEDVARLIEAVEGREF